MKIRHRIPSRPLTSDPVDEAYQREVDRATSRTEREYASALGRFLRQQAKAEAAQAKADRPGAPAEQVRTAAQAWAMVELRRSELAYYERILQASPASAQHRGRRSFRPVPPTE